ncbi:MAG: hypothetical protein CME65_11105 [Halobacteriovoraceae bacterium]|nr:hypothetical protein [Halobacteriovoraceae bacterium]|tara:strand:+ start:5170 stop:5967 length:798 start_codon:yes stop_codon:yes gene_type:complete
MNSTSISETVLTIKDLTISYNFSRYQAKGIRDLFVSFFTSPFTFIFSRQQKVDVLRDFNLNVKKGDIVGILGINGAGKTTLCRTIAGMYGSRDEIEVNGLLRAIFDTASVIQPELSGRENAWIITNILYSHLPKKERKAIVEDSLEFTELNEYIDSPFKIYSKGMKVRLFLSIVSARPCGLLILDEVFNGADKYFNEKISNRIRGVIKESGAVLFISHSEEVIRDVCNRAIVIGNQQLLYDGSVDGAIGYYNQHFSLELGNELQL